MNLFTIQNPFALLEEETKVTTTKIVTATTKRGGKTEATLETKVETITTVKRTTKVFLQGLGDVEVDQESSSKGIYWLDAQSLLRLRYAQASMKGETRDGLSLEELINNIRNEGFNSKYPIRVVIMERSIGDTPKKEKAVAFDTRRKHAVRQLARENLSGLRVPIEIHYGETKAEVEFEGMRHLVFDNKKIPERVRADWIKSWYKWNDLEFLKTKNITKGSWAHLVKLRMAMTQDSERKRRVAQESGFKESPYKIRNFVGRAVSNGYNESNISNVASTVLNFRNPLAPDMNDYDNNFPTMTSYFNNPVEKETIEKETVEKETVEKETVEKETVEKETVENNDYSNNAYPPNFLSRNAYSQNPPVRYFQPNASGMNTYFNCIPKNQYS